MKKAIIFLLTVLIFVSALAPMGASAVYNSFVETETEIFYIESLDTGTVIFEKNSTVKAAPASLTKIVTAAVVLENCSDLDEVITVKEESIRALDGTGSSLAGIKIGEEITIRNLLYCLMVSSANEASMILADHVAGSVDKFVRMMNSLAKELGCINTNFANPHGLDDENHYSCAVDMATLAKYAMQFPVFNEITSTREYTLPETNKNPERKITTTNYMMMQRYKEYYLAEAKGVKTGSTSNAGKCVVTTATKNGYSYIAVAMKAPFYDYDKDGYDENFAFMDTKAMLNWTFDNIKLKTVAQPSQIVTVSDVKYAADVDYVRLVPAEEYFALVPAAVDFNSVLIEPVDGSFPEHLEAPVKKGEEICEAVVSYAGEEIARIKLVAAEDVELSLLSFVKGKFSELSKTVGFKVFVVLLALVIIFFVAANVYVNKARKKRRLRIVNYRDVNKK